jgi:hypothetical protein
MTHCNHHHHATVADHIVCEVSSNQAIMTGGFFILTTIAAFIYAKGTAVITNHPYKVAALAVVSASAYLKDSNPEIFDVFSYFLNQPKNENSKVEQHNDNSHDCSDHEHRELNMEDNLINNPEELID